MLFSIIIGMAIASLLIWACMNECLFSAIILVAVPFGIYSCNQSDYWEQAEKERHEYHLAEIRSNAIPRLYSTSPDGCKVYTFKTAERWAYFTRCGSQTTTETSHSVSCGKNCTKQEVDVITTENK